ncbi:MAG: phosphate ABC transporter substrate-binding protein [Rhodocyclaceae bacterium]|nr:phosphate ABC transporter substrate-binding protein [Rhodocyclaceae bacterium]
MHLDPKLIAALFVAAACSVPFGTRAQQVVVIANPALQLTAADLPDIFLGEKQFAGSVKLLPVDNSGLQEQFLNKALSMDAAKYNGRWVKKSFRDGVNPPPIKSGDAEVGEYVKRTPGAVGYVGSAPAGVTVVNKY